MKLLVAVIAGVVMTGGAALADMGVPFHSPVSVWTTVVLPEAIPEYVFFAEELPQKSQWVPITFEANSTTAVAPHGYRGTRLIAVPREFAERYKSPAEV